MLDKHRDPVLSERLDELIRDARITIEPVTVEQARIARQAYRDYGRGSGHPANLNFGDCFSYALAATSASPCSGRATTLGIRISGRRPRGHDL